MAETAEKKKGKIVVLVHNEDDGDKYKLHAEKDDRLQVILDTLYRKKLQRDPLPGDRVRCESSGEDVVQFASLTVKQYLNQGHCPKLEWLFAGDTGGA